MRLLAYGDRGLLVELADTATAVSAAAALRADTAVAELVADVVPGARTVLLVARPGVPPPPAGPKYPRPKTPRRPPPWVLSPRHYRSGRSSSPSCTTAPTSPRWRR